VLLLLLYHCKDFKQLKVFDKVSEKFDLVIGIGLLQVVSELMSLPVAIISSL